MPLLLVSLLLVVPVFLLSPPRAAPAPVPATAESSRPPEGDSPRVRDLRVQLARVRDELEQKRNLLRAMEEMDRDRPQREARQLRRGLDPKEVARTFDENAAAIPAMRKRVDGIARAVANTEWEMTALGAKP